MTDYPGPCAPSSPALRGRRALGNAGRLEQLSQGRTAATDAREHATERVTAVCRKDTPVAAKPAFVGSVTSGFGAR